jgi:hypothetical protein
MRFTLRGLLVAIAFVAVSVVALLYANWYWVGAARSVVILSLSIAVCGGIFARGAARAFWLGFAILGWIHFASVGFAHWRGYGYLITDQGISWLHTKVAREQEMMPSADDPFGPRGTPLRPIIVRRPDLDYFEKVARCITTIVIAGLGGFVGVYFQTRGKD